VPWYVWFLLGAALGATIGILAAALGYAAAWSGR
jgi:hypothetical protein